MITHQGTWQFMSSKLISDPNWRHDFQDDLESSIYVLLWVMLMYSTCSNPAQVVPFMEGVLDPQPHAMGSGFGKSDFLIGKSFLGSVQFSGRPAFDTLLLHLASLFSLRYSVPFALPPLNSGNVVATLQAHSTAQKDVDEEKEKAGANITHEAIISTFDFALRNPSEWPDDDHAVHQEIELHSREFTTVGTGWDTLAFLLDLDNSEVDGEDEDEPQEDIVMSDDLLICSMTEVYC